ncbi:uncharacterized protein [Molothrus aeneus]|uniref:uncharacterized protein n=1 Tax=Molothrus aeneus TaxID=84833 RepID=UPI00345A0558
MPGTPTGPPPGLHGTHAVRPHPDSLCSPGECQHPGGKIAGPGGCQFFSGSTQAGKRLGDSPRNLSLVWRLCSADKSWFLHLWEVTVSSFRNINAAKSDSHLSAAPRRRCSPAWATLDPSVTTGGTGTIAATADRSVLPFPAKTGWRAAAEPAPPSPSLHTRDRHFHDQQELQFLAQDPPPHIAGEGGVIPTIGSGHNHTGCSVSFLIISHGACTAVPATPIVNTFRRVSVPADIRPPAGFPLLFHGACADDSDLDRRISTDSPNGSPFWVLLKQQSESWKEDEFMPAESKDL